MKKRVKLIIGLGIIFLSMGVFCYSTISSTWNEYVASKLINEYTTNIGKLSEVDYSLELKKAQNYNNSLDRTTGLVSGVQFEEDETYEDALNLAGDGMMGYIEIPDISQKLPIYHYTNDEALKSGIGHLHGSSLPIGGEGNSILTGHTGLPENMLFTRLDELEVNDSIYVHVLDLNLAYKVIEINVVLPEEVNNLRIENNKDLVTLITCTPYGVNSHRLVVVGERTDYPEDRKEISATTVIRDVVSKWRIYVSVGVIIIIIVILKKRNNKPTRSEEKHEKKGYNTVSDDCCRSDYSDNIGSHESDDKK